MTIPTGQGLTMGLDSANPAGTPLPNRVARAQSNDAKAIKGETSDPCYCGCCTMSDARWM
jgi:hypothetical protein